MVIRIVLVNGIRIAFWFDIYILLSPFPDFLGPSVVLGDLLL